MQMLLGKKVLFHGQHAPNVHLLQYSFKKKKDRNGSRYLSCFYYKVYCDHENQGKQRLQSVVVIGLPSGKANVIDKWRPYSLCSEKTMKNGSSYVSRSPYPMMTVPPTRRWGSFFIIGGKLVPRVLLKLDRELFCIYTSSRGIMFFQLLQPSVFNRLAGLQ